MVHGIRQFAGPHEPPAGSRRGVFQSARGLERAHGSGMTQGGIGTGALADGGCAKCALKIACSSREVIPCAVQTISSPRLLRLLRQPGLRCIAATDSRWLRPDIDGSYASPPSSPADSMRRAV